LLGTQIKKLKKREIVFFDHIAYGNRGDNSPPRLSPFTNKRSSIYR